MGVLSCGSKPTSRPGKHSEKNECQPRVRLVIISKSAIRYHYHFHVRSIPLTYPHILSLPLNLHPSYLGSDMPQITCLLDLYHHTFGLRPSHIYANLYVSLLFHEWLHHKRLLLEVCYLPLFYCISNMSIWWFLKTCKPPK